MFNRVDQLRFFIVDYINNAFQSDPKYQHIKVPYYIESQDASLATKIRVTINSQDDENIFMGDFQGTCYGYFSFYKKKDAPNVSIADFVVKPSMATAPITDKNRSIFQLDFVPSSQDPNKNSLIVSRLDLRQIDITDPTTTFVNITDNDVLYHTIALFQGNEYLKKDIHFTVDSVNKKINFLAVPSDGSYPIVPVVDPPLQILYFYKVSQEVKDDIKEGDILEDVIPHTIIYLSKIKNGDVYNIRRDQSPTQSYYVHGGICNYHVEIMCSASNSSDQETMYNYLTQLFRNARIVLPTFGITLTEITGNKTDGSELDASGDLSREFIISFNLQVQFQIYKPYQTYLFKFYQFIFESYMDSEFDSEPGAENVTIDKFLFSEFVV